MDNARQDTWTQGPRGASLASYLYAAFRNRPRPVVSTPRGTCPGASLWAGGKGWADAFRGAGLVPGDRVVLASEPSPGWLMALTGAVRAGLTVAIERSGCGAAGALATDARLAIVTQEEAADCSVPAWTEAEGGGVRPGPVRAAQHAPTPDIAIALSTSGTSGTRRMIALSDQNVCSVLASHLPALGLWRTADAVSMSALPWSHAFGFVIDLLPALMDAEVVVRDSSEGRDADAMIAAARQWGVCHASFVPMQIRRLSEARGGMDFLRSLRGGVVGGAAVDAELAEILRETRLRVGYGQTEAAPGVCLGEPGAWHAGTIGRALGCEVQTSVTGHLMVRGDNVCVGMFADGALTRYPAGRWLDTRDLVREDHRGLTYVGRADDRFKLSNGRFVHGAKLSAALVAGIRGATEACVFQTSGDTIGVALVGHVAPGFEPAMRDALGALGGRVARVMRYTPAGAPRTRKGDLDARVIAQAVRGLSTSEEESFDVYEHAA